MVDHQFADPGLAEVYDAFHPWESRDDLDFHLEMVMAADAVLDVGCGTGSLLHRAREEGHRGRLCGLDPAAGMLARARRRPDVEWVLGELPGAAWRGEFDLVVMTGHAFQVHRTDDELRSVLAAVRAALADGGRFAFETRNPRSRPWRRWTPEHAVEAPLPGGTVVRMAHRVDAVDGDVVRFTTTFSSPGWARPRISRSALRFLDRPALAAFLTEAGLAIETQYGDWDRRPPTDTSPEIITVARPAP